MEKELDWNKIMDEALEDCMADEIDAYNDLIREVKKELDKIVVREYRDNIQLIHYDRNTGKFTFNLLDIGYARLQLKYSFNYKGEGKFRVCYWNDTWSNGSHIKGYVQTVSEIIQVIKTDRIIRALLPLNLPLDI
jgi:hypothetical protein